MSTPNDPIGITEAFRRDIDAIDARTIAAVLRIYRRARLRITEQVDALIAALGDPTRPVTANAISLARQAELLQQIETWLTRAGVQAEPALMQARQQAVEAALSYAERMAQAQGFTLKDRIDLARAWTRLDERAVTELVETMADGTPMREWLRELGSDTAERVEQAIERAVTEKVNVGELAEELTKEVDMSQRRALMVTRESSFGVQRRANDQVYKANASRLSGKMRDERLDAKTCRACLALHGTIYPVDAQMPGHVGCRRIEVPILRSGRGVQAPDENAVEYLESLPEDQQRMVLGSQDGVEAWKSGEVELDDFSEVYETEWGPQTRIVGVERARANAARRRAGDRRAAD